MVLWMFLCRNKVTFFIFGSVFRFFLRTHVESWKGTSAITYFLKITWVYQINENNIFLQGETYFAWKQSLQQKYCLGKYIKPHFPQQKSQQLPTTKVNFPVLRQTKRIRNDLSQIKFYKPALFIIIILHIAITNLSFANTQGNPFSMHSA